MKRRSTNENFTTSRYEDTNFVSQTTWFGSLEFLLYNAIFNMYEPNTIYQIRCIFSFCTFDKKIDDKCV